MRETARAKAHRLLQEGRIMILRVDPAGRVDARCRGEGQIHRLGFEWGEWRCTCDHHGTNCSHLLALRSVVALQRTN